MQPSNLTAASGLPRRVIVAAAILSARFGNPDVAAFNRARGAGQSRRGRFWHSVGRALYRHPCGCPTAHELAVRQDIRAALAGATGETAKPEGGAA